jgi:hypothetical protein
MAAGGMPAAGLLKPYHFKIGICFPGYNIFLQKHPLGNQSLYMDWLLPLESGWEESGLPEYHPALHRFCLPACFYLITELKLIKALKTL